MKSSFRYLKNAVVYSQSPFRYFINEGRRLINAVAYYKKNVVYLQFSGRFLLCFLLVSIIGLKCINIGLLALPITPAAKLSAGMKTATSLSRDNLDTKVGKISHREICPAEI